MDWIRENWIFILFFIFFIWMHLSGHGCCGGHDHGKHGQDKKDEGHEGHCEKDHLKGKDR